MPIDNTMFEQAVSEARRIQQESGFLPALDDRRLNVGDIVSLSVLGRRNDDLEGLIGLAQPGDHATRVVVARTLFSLVSLGSIDRDEYGESLDLKAVFSDFVESVPVADLFDPALLRWEVHVAAIVRALARVIDLARRFEAVGPSTETRALLARTAFVMIHPSHLGWWEDLPSAFDPIINAPDWHLNHVSDFFTYAMATTVEKRGDWAWSEPESFSGPVLDALIDIDALLKRIQSTTKSLTPTLAAIQSWCWFAQGSAAHDPDMLNQAGRSYRTLAKFPMEEFPTGINRDLTSTLPAATKCFGLASNWSATVETARLWVSEAPTDGKAHRRLAEAHYKLGEIPEALRAFEECLGLSTESDDDWVSSMALQMGLELHERRAALAMLETAAFSANIRPQAERLIAWFHPWFDALSTRTKKRWWVGMYSVSSPHVGTEMESERWDIAADSFGEAVAFELKDRIFGPFAASMPLNPPDEYWRRALERRGTLGEMINCLRQTQMSHTTIAKQLAIWLKTHHSQLFSHIHKSSTTRLAKMSNLRNEAQHGSVTEAETREVFADATELLQAIARK